MRMGGQWATCRRQHAGDRRLAEQTIEQVLTGESGGTGDKNVLWGQVHAVVSCPLQFSLVFCRTAGHGTERTLGLALA